MLILGVLSFLQIVFVPGFLLLHTVRYRDTVLAKLVYSFALSLLTNYLLVYGLVAAGIYYRALIGTVVAAEWMALAAVLGRERFQLQFRWRPSAVGPTVAARWLSQIPIAVSLATLLVFIWIFFSDLGSVFCLGDDVISWNAWAIAWTNGHVPGSGYYPTLLPANWSVTYKMIGTTDVNLFAKAIMPLFPMAVLLLFLDRFHKTRSLCWIAGLNLYAALLFHFFDIRFLTAGYLDLPTGFFAFLTFAAFLEAERRPPEDRAALLAPVIFAATALVVKQGGIFVFAGAVTWWGLLLFRRRCSNDPHGTARLVAIAVCATIVISWWWIAKEWNVATGRESAVAITLARVTGESPDYSARFAPALQLLLARRSGAYFSWAIAALLATGLLRPLSRAVLAGFVAPYFVVYALFFSYEARSFSMAIPFLALCAGGGAEALWLLARRTAAALRTPRFRIPALLILSAAAVLGAVAAPSFLQSRRFPDDPWMQDIVRLWPAALLLSVVLVSGFNLLSRKRSVSFRLNTLWLAAPALVAIVLLNATVLNARALLAQQLEAQRTSIGKPDVNRKLYEYVAAAPLQGLIATNYWYLGTLPNLKEYYQSFSFPAAIGPQLLEEVLAEKKKVRYFLIRDADLTPEARHWIEARGLHAAFTIDDYSLIPVPR